MDNKQKKKSYVIDKVIIIGLSLIVLFNGAGLIVAGKRVNNKKWTSFGIAYIVSEWILSFTGAGVTIAVLLYFASIIHTALICNEYGLLLEKRDLESQISEKNIISGSNVDDIVVNNVQSNVSEKNEPIKSEKKEVDYNSIQLEIGTASVTGEKRSNTKIKIQNENGKVYVFNTDGNEINDFSINGKMYSYGG